jgi:hypothetical protein
MRAESSNSSEFQPRPAAYVRAMRQRSTLLDDRDQHVGRDRDPDLGLHGVLAGTEECLDAQMLLDPLEEKFHLPATLIEGANRQRRQRHLVREEDQRFAGFRVLEADAPQVRRIMLLK